MSDGGESDARRVARDKLLAALARREHSRAELKQKYAQAFAQDLLDEIIAELIAKDWQNDARFAAQFVRSAVAKGQGRIKIHYGLSQHQIDEALISELLDDVDWAAQVRAVYARKYRTPAQSMAEKAKRQRFLAQRGFSYDDINLAMKNNDD